jgi:O-succinylbenzoic acid--CoA ligase
MDLVELSYSYIKEGSEFEKSIGQFLLDWLDHSTTLEVKTSGSTGKPKTILLKKEYMVNSALATGSYFGLSAKDSAVLCLPAGYIAGMMMLVRAMVLGLNLYIIPPSSSLVVENNRSFDFGAMVPLQVMNSLPLVHKIKTLLIGGASVSAALRSKLADGENSIYESYGMTETITHIAVRALNNLKGAANGGGMPFQTLPNIKLSQDQRGCLVIDAPKVSDETIITNDVVELISETEFRWMGRFDNVINSGGVKLNPERIEQILSGYLTMPFFVTGIEDDRLGQKLVLLVEGNDSLDTVQAILNSVPELHTYQRPKQILSTARFQRTLSGKIKRKKTLQQVLVS